jgi:hypothetical protein
MEKKLPYRFTYLGIVDEQFAVFPEQFVPAQPHTCNIRLRFHYSSAQRHIASQAECRFMHEGEVLFTYAAITCLFELDEASWSARQDESTKEVVIGKDILRHFGAFTVGTLRGYLHARLLPTSVRVSIPPINVTELVDSVQRIPIGEQ